MGFFYLRDHGKSRARGKIVFEGFNLSFRSFGYSLHGTVRAVAHIADYLVPRGGPLSKKAVAHSLHLAAYHKLSRHPV